MQTSLSGYWISIIYIALLAVGIPWYWPANDTTVWFGVPAWVVIAIIVGALTSFFTLWLLLRPWPDEDGE